MYRYLKDYSRSRVVNDNFIDVKEPESRHQDAIEQRPFEKPLDSRNNPEHCLTCGRCEPKFEVNNDLVEFITKTVEELQNSRIGKIDSDCS